MTHGSLGTSLQLSRSVLLQTTSQTKVDCLCRSVLSINRIHGSMPIKTLLDFFFKILRRSEQAAVDDRILLFCLIKNEAKLRQHLKCPVISLKNDHISVVEKQAVLLTCLKPKITFSYNFCQFRHKCIEMSNRKKSIRIWFIRNSSKLVFFVSCFGCYHVCRSINGPWRNPLIIVYFLLWQVFKNIFCVDWIFTIFGEWK